MRVLTGALFYTCDPAHRETHALACDDAGIITALGDDALAIEGKRIELAGFATPALTDAHAHLGLMARAAMEIDLTACLTPDAVLAELDGDWIVGHGLSFPL